MEEGALHVVMMALEDVGAVVRVGYGPDALYALNSHGLTSQILQCQSGELRLILHHFTARKGPH